VKKSRALFFIPIPSMKTLLLALVLTTLFASPLTAQFDTTYYTKFRVGGKLPATINLKGKAKLFCFASETSCFICMESLHNMQEWVEKYSCVDMQLFLATSDDSLANKLKTQYNWKFGVASDPFGVIHTGFGVVQTPFYYLVDGSGTIQAMGAIGSASDNWESATLAMKSICVDRASNNRIARLDREFIINCSGRTFSPSLQRSAQTFNSGKSHSVSLTASAQIIIVDNDTCRFGGETKLLLSQDLGYSMIPMSSSSDTVFYLHGMPDEGGSVPFHSISSSLRKLSSDTIVAGPGNRFWLFAGVSKGGRMIANSLTIQSGNGDSNATVEPIKTDNSIAVATMTGGRRVTRLLGRFEDMFRRYDLSGYYWQCVAFKDDSTLCYVQNLSDTLREISLADGHSTSTPICFDTTIWLTSWKQFAKSAAEPTTLEHQKSLRDYSSTLHAILIDEANGFTYVAFINSDVLGGSSEFALTGPIGKASCRTIAIPNGAAPHSIIAGRVHATNVIEGVLRLQEYILP